VSLATKRKDVIDGHYQAEGQERGKDQEADQADPQEDVVVEDEEEGDEVPLLRMPPAPGW
jgi:hypothetical protein